MNPQVTIARLYALEGQEQAARAILADAQTGTHGEPGCRLYALHVDEADPRSFVMIEIFDDDDAFGAHMASSHVQELIARSDGVFAGPPEIQRLNALPFGDGAKGAVTGG